MAAILLGSFAANLGSSASAVTATTIAIGDTLEALVGATLLLRVGFQPALRWRC